MKNKDFLTLMQRYVANIAISGSTLRNQGAENVVENARNFLATVDLGAFRRIDPSRYAEQLDVWSAELQQELPDGAKHWGTARKALNVFMVQVFLNKHLAEEYGLEKFKDVLEIPLDSQATAELRRRAGRRKLPRWESIRGLREKDSLRYQEFASVVAAEEELPRACLDIMLWRASKIKHKK